MKDVVRKKKSKKKEFLVESCLIAKQPIAKRKGHNQSIFDPSCGKNLQNCGHFQMSVRDEKNIS